MNILFFTLVDINGINDINLYADLVRKFVKNGHSVYVINPLERRKGKKSYIIKESNLTIYKVKTLNIQKTNYIEKTLSTLSFDRKIINTIKKNLSAVGIDCVLYSTPPITLTRAIKFVKKRYNAKSYLLLKDIFPQNAIDLGIMNENGFIHKIMRKKEKTLYEISDFIGCMSPENLNYLINNNPEIEREKIEVNPNSIELNEKKHINAYQRKKLREYYSIPSNSILFIYGGNLGKPQGLEFLLEVVEANKMNHAVFFLIVGSGTKFSEINTWFRRHKPLNAKLIKQLPVNDYNKLLQISDVGMIFLNNKFTIPNFPSRLLSYLDNKMPVIAATDLATDLRKIIEENNFGFWAQNGDLAKFQYGVNQLATDRELRKKMGENGYKYLVRNHDVNVTYNKIMMRVLSHKEHKH